MQVSVENVGKLERRLMVSVPADRLDTQVQKRLRELSRSVRLKGFRPGKVPAKVIEQRYGRQVRSEALGDLVRETFNEAVRQENLRPAAAPSIETSGTPEDGEIRYVATFEVMPEIGEIDVTSLNIIKPVASVEDADIDAMIQTLRSQRRSFEPVEREAAAGDLVLFESAAVTAEGRVPAEGSERAGTIVGSNALFAELEARLIGLKSGDEGSFELTFPAGYRVQALAGKAATVEVRVVRVSEATLPEVDQAFLESFGITEGGIDRFRQEVRANLERELRGALMARLKSEVADKLLAAHTELEFPVRMIDREAEGLARAAEQQAKARGQAEAKFEPAGFREAARKRVAAAVLLGEIARQHQIRLDPARVADMLATIASTYEEPEQVVELYRADAQLMMGLESRVLEDQVIDWIADHAQLQTQQLSFDEVMRPGTA